MRKSSINSVDDCLYIMPKKAIEFATEILKEYGSRKPACEGIAYFGGKKEGNVYTITIVVAPFAQATPCRVVTDHFSNARYIRLLSENKLIHIGQIHTHPGKWVDHSEGDDKWVPFKVNGLISIVAPFYGMNGLLPIKICGIHRFENESFCRLSNKYLHKHFVLTDDVANFCDQRKIIDPDE